MVMNHQHSGRSNDIPTSRFRLKQNRLQGCLATRQAGGRPRNSELTLSGYGKPLPEKEFKIRGLTISGEIWTVFYADIIELI